MSLKRVIHGVFATLISVSGLAVLSTSSVFAGQNLTWTGTDCTGSSPTNCDWSDAANWGGTAFANGDNVTFPNSIISSIDSPTVDTTDTAGSITFTGTNSVDSSASIKLAAGLTVDSAITQDSTDSATSDIFQNTGSAEAITLGGNVLITTNAGLSLGFLIGPSDTINLNGSTLSFTQAGSGAGGIQLYDIIAEAGGVVYDMPTASAISEYENNTYSGTTSVESGSVSESGSAGNNAFGTSAISVASGADIDFNPATASISNDITIDGTTNGSPVVSLDFDNSGTGVNTLTVPNISLAGNTRFSNDSLSSPKLAINLAGIHAGSNCIEYLSSGSEVAASESSAGFSNGPAYCVFATSTSTATTPKTPNTGLAAIRANALTVLGSTTVAAAALLIVARRLSKASKH